MGAVTVGDLLGLVNVFFLYLIRILKSCRMNLLHFYATLWQTLNLFTNHFGSKACQRKQLHSAKSLTFLCGAKRMLNTHC